MWGTINLSSANLVLAASLLVLLGATSTLCDPYPWAENVCNQSVPTQKDIVVEKPVMYEIKVQSMCNFLPCVKTRTETRNDQSIRTVVQMVERSACCPGYTETPDRKCAPICVQSCNNGAKCLAPNTCKCSPEPMDASPGFVGPTCNRFVCSNDDRWGSRCDKSCNCFGNSYCAADTGKCLCYPGWRGANCTQECDPFSNSAECQESNRLPPIIEPEANLMNANLVLERHRPEPLVLDDEVKITDANYLGQDWRGLSTNYLIVGLSVVSMVFIIAFLVTKRRYEQIRNELQYAASTYQDNSSTYSEPPPYDSASQSSGSASVVVPSNGNLEKNFSFATATRNILLGKDLNSLQASSGLIGKGEARNRMVLDPRVESHLIVSQKQAKQNLYSGVAVDMRESSEVSPERPLSPPAYSTSDEHIYQVPKSISPSVGTGANLSDLSANESLLANNSNRLDRTLDEDSTSNIYEELKPRK